MTSLRKPYRSHIRFSLKRRNKMARSAIKAIYLALHPDTKYFSKDSSSVSDISVEGHTITVRVEASDISSLRASLNSYLMLFSLCVNVLSER